MNLDWERSCDSIISDWVGYKMSLLKNKDFIIEIT